MFSYLGMVETISADPYLVLHGWWGLQSLREVTLQKYCPTRKVIFEIPDDKLKLKTIVKDIRRMTRDAVMINLLRKGKISECLEYYFFQRNINKSYLLNSNCEKWKWPPAVRRFIKWNVKTKKEPGQTMECWSVEGGGRVTHGGAAAGGAGVGVLVWLSITFILPPVVFTGVTTLTLATGLHHSHTTIGWNRKISLRTEIYLSLSLPFCTMVVIQAS